jgi:hypothetical protein
MGVILMVKKERERPTDEMSEKNLVEALKIFDPDGNWETQKRFSYDPENKRKFYKVDAISETKKIVWEYDGPNHYNDTWKFHRDLERDSYFVNLGYKMERWPYFYQLTKDVAKKIFNENFSDKKYKDAIKKIYGVKSETSILAPGWHTTTFTPGSWIEKGVDRFIRRLEEMPKSLKHQITYSLILYIESVGNPFLIIGDHKKLHDLIKLEIDKKYIDYYYNHLYKG